MPKKDSNAIEPIYKREIFYEKDGSFTINNKRYVEVSKQFADSIVKAMKNDLLYEDIMLYNGVNYMREDKYEVYKAISKSLKI